MKDIIPKVSNMKVNGQTSVRKSEMEIGTTG
jgi:hypothetical protein